MLPDLRLNRAEHLQIWESDFSGVQTKNKKKQTTNKVEVKVKRSRKITLQNLGLETQRKVWFQSYVKTENGEQDGQRQMWPYRHRYRY